MANAGALALLCSCQSVWSQPRTIVSAIEGQPVEIEAISFVFRIDDDDHPVTVTLDFSEADQDQIIVSDGDRGKFAEQISLPSARFPDLDINSIDLRHFSIENNGELIRAISIGLKYGDVRSECFTNYDGRNMINLTIGENELLEATDYGYENCTMTASSYDFTN